MSRNTTRYTKAVETLTNNGMTDAEAETYIYRSLLGVTRGDTARELDKSASTVDELYRRAKDKAKLPRISGIDTAARVGENEDRAVVIHFENGAKLQYRATDETVLEESFSALNPHGAPQSMDIGVFPEDLHEAALESVGEYLNSYEMDPEACRADWSNVFEAVTMFGVGPGER